jgi:disulfide bond formation protein DsbB
MSAIMATRTGRAALLLLALSAGTLLAAWGFQLIGGYAPCPLCLKQRWSYYAVVVLAGMLVAILGGDPGRAGLVRRGDDLYRP